MPVAFTKKLTGMLSAVQPRILPATLIPITGWWRKLQDEMGGECSRSDWGRKFVQKFYAET
jgi:hypothetical protein